MINEFLGKCLALRAKHPYSVTSWFRTEQRNHKVGGSHNSQHLLGLAMDIVPETPREDWEKVALDAERLGLVSIMYTHHIHLQALKAT